MDLLKNVLGSIRLEGSTVSFSTGSSPSLMRVAHSGRPQMHLVLDGCAWVKCSSHPEPFCLRRGDALYLNETGLHSVADNPRLQQSTVSVTANSESECHVVCASFGLDAGLRHPIVDALPAHILLSIPDERHAFWTVLRVMMEELESQQSGYTAIVDKICELFLIYILRTHAARQPNMPGIVNAMSDPITCRALQLIHQQPDSNWTLESLAGSVGLSRSAFAGRFRRLVGVPPKTYLTTWRMHTAKRLLNNSGARIATVSRQVGYSSDIAFARAFKQFFGESPSAARSSIPKVSAI